MSIRRGTTLVEVMVYVAVLATLIGLLLPAIQQVRAAAARMETLNSCRQLVLAVHQTADAKGGHLCTIDGHAKFRFFPELPGWAYETRDSVYEDWLPIFTPYGRPGYKGPLPGFVPEFNNKHDPSLLITDGAQLIYPVGLTYNALAGVGEPTLSSTFSDGLSNTILLAEHYSRCGEANFRYSQFKPGHRSPGGHRVSGDSRRPTFADGGPLLGGQNEQDVYPVTDPVTHITRASRPGATFQVRPKVWQQKLACRRPQGAAVGRVRRFDPPGQPPRRTGGRPGRRERSLCTPWGERAGVLGGRHPGRRRSPRRLVNTRRVTVPLTSYTL